MKKVLLASILSLGAAGCAMTPTQNPTQVTLYQACGSLYLAQTGAQALRSLNKLSVPEIQQLTIAQKTLVPLCNPNSIPADPNAAAQQITQAVTTGVLSMGLQYSETQAAKTPAQTTTPATK